MHHGTCVTHVPWCMPGLLTSGFLWIQRRGKRSRHSRRMLNPQFTYLVRGPLQRQGIATFTCNTGNIIWNIKRLGIWSNLSVYSHLWTTFTNMFNLRLDYGELMTSFSLCRYAFLSCFNVMLVFFYIVQKEMPWEMCNHYSSARS